MMLWRGVLYRGLMPLYNEGDPLVFSENTFEGNLTSILDFYAYLIIAIDFDSFSPRGGEPYYKKAQDIVYRAQSSGESGWRALEDTQLIRVVVYTLLYTGLDDCI